MSIRSRVDEVERHLSPKQLLLVDVRDSRRRHATFIDYARAAAAESLTGLNLMDQIEASVLATNRSVDRRAKIHMVRKAQQEGMFLARLATQCATAVADEERELELMTGFLMVYQVVLADRLGEMPEDSHAIWLEGALNHRLRMLSLLAAARLVEEEYFDGAQVVFKASHEHLDQNLRTMSMLIAAWNERVAGLLRAVEESTGATEPEKRELRKYLAGLRADPAPAEREVQQAARRLARGWITLVGAQVLDEFGEQGQATAILNELILGEGHHGQARSPPPAEPAIWGPFE